MSTSRSFFHKRNPLWFLLFGYWLIYGVFLFLPLPFFVRAVLFFVLITTSSLYLGLKGGILALAYYIVLVLIYWIWHPVQPFGLVGGSLVGLLIALLVGLHRDQIQKKSEALAKNEARYRALFENSLNGLALHEAILENGRMVDFIYVQVNKAFLDQVGLVDTEVLGKRGLEIFPQLDQEILEICGEVALTGRPIKSETYIAFFNGWYEISIFSHQKSFFTISLTDITERKEAEEALRTSKEGYESLVTTIPGVVYRAQFNVYRSMEYVSPMIQDLLGYDEDVFYKEGSFYNSRIYFEDRGHVQEALERAIERGEKYSLEHRIINARGKVRWVRDEGLGVFDSKGDLLYLDGFILDITSKKEAIKALEKSEARFRSYVQNAGEIIFSLAPDGRFTYVSPKWEEELGHRAEEVEGQNFAPFIHPEDLYACLETIHAIFTSASRVKGFEFRAFHKEGHWLWFSVSAALAYDEESGASTIVGIARNITDRKKAREELERSRDDLARLTDEYKRIFQTTHDAIFIVDVVDRDTFHYRRTNRSYQEQTGLDLKTIKGQRPEDLFEEEMAAAINRRYQQCVEAKEDVMYEERLVLPVGERIYQTMLSPVIEKGEVIQLVGSSRDITAYQKTTEELKRQKNLLNSIFDNAPISIWVTDKDQDFLMVNQHFERQTLISSSHPSITKEELSICYESDKRALEEDKPTYCEEALTFVDGERHLLSVIKTRLYDEEGEIKGILGLGVDITERKRAEEALKKISSEQQLLLNTIETHVWYMQDELTYGKVNHSHARFHGLAPEEMEGKEIIAVHGSSRGELWKEIVKKAFEKRRQIYVKDWFQDDLQRKRLLAITMTPHTKERRVEYVVCSAHDITEQERERRLLADESAILSYIAQSISEITSILERICILVENQEQGLYCSIQVFDEKSNTLSCYAAPTLGEEFRYLMIGIEVGPEGPPCAQSVYFKDRAECPNIKDCQGFKDYRNLLPEDLAACWSLPILSQEERVLGTIDIYAKEPGSPSPFIIRLMETASTLAGIAIERIESERRISEYTMAIELKNMELEDLYTKMDEEVEKARRIHSRTLPTTCPLIEGLSIYAHYKPAAKMGGDFYNFKKIGDKLLFYLSDVTGHGLDGALMSIFVKNTIDNYLNLAPAQKILPSCIFQYLTHQYLDEGFPEDYFISLFLGILDLSKGELIYSSAGLHVSPLAFDRGGGMEELIAGNLPISPTIPLDLLVYQDEILRFSQRSTLFFTTDGLAEQRSGELSYNDRLRRVLKEHYYLPPEAMAQALNQDFREFSGQWAGDDDITFLILQLHSQEEPPSFHRVISSNYQALVETREEAKTFLVEHLKPLEDIDELIVSFHELLINAMEHGNRREDGEIEALIVIEKRYIMITVNDKGVGFDWRAKIDQDPLELQEDVSNRGRGLGLMLISLASDFFYYNSKGDKATVIKLRPT